MVMMKEINHLTLCGCVK